MHILLFICYLEKKRKTISYPTITTDTITALIPVVDNVAAAVISRKRTSACFFYNWRRIYHYFLLLAVLSIVGVVSAFSRPPSSFSSPKSAVVHHPPTISMASPLRLLDVSEAPNGETKGKIDEAPQHHQGM